MEEFFQYIGPNDDVVLSSTLLNHERMFVYSSPRENPIDRCGELRVGSYFACSSVLFYDDNIWIKIRRGYFSNINQNGYIRVYLKFPTGSQPMDGCDLPSRQRSSVVTAQPAQFRHIRRLPQFPTYMCAYDRLVLYREPVFTLHSTSVSSSSPLTSSSTLPRHMQRYLPPVSVFRATECRFNQDFTQLSIKVTSALVGLSGWINTSFHKMLIEVEDPEKFGFFHHGPLYMQNVAGRGGKWAGELPVRAIPSLQAPRLYNVESFRVVRAIERKLLKDRVWIRIQPLQKLKQLQLFGGETKSEEEHDIEVEGENDQEEKQTAGPDAWIIERNANTAQRVVVPWRNDRIWDVPVDDDAERFYRTVYSRRPLPLRRTADLEAEIVGHLEPGFVFSSTHRILNDRGHMWIRVALPSEAHLSKSVADDVGESDNANSNFESNVEESKEEEEEFEDLGESVRYGYVIQSNAKTNTCMVQEIPSPGKMNPKQYYQVSLLSDDTQAQTTSSSNAEKVTGSATENTLPACAEASSSAKELFYVRNGAIVSAIGSVYNAKEGRMWLQVLAMELDPAMRVKTQWPLSEAEQKLNVVYLPICDPNRNSPESVLKPIHRELVRIDNPLQAETNGQRAPSRVVFTGRASKLFGSHLLRPSTIGLSSAFPAKQHGPELQSSGITVSDPVVGENDRTQSLKDEITAWQLQTGKSRMTQLSTQLGSLVGYTLSCIRRPFASCLAHQEAKRRYQQLDQNGQDMEEYALDDNEVNVEDVKYSRSIMSRKSDISFLLNPQIGATDQLQVRVTPPQSRIPSVVTALAQNPDVTSTFSMLLNSCITPLDKKRSYRSEKPLLPVLPALKTGARLSSSDLEEEELTSTSDRKEKQIENVVQTQAISATLKPKDQVMKTRTVCKRKRTTRMPPCQVKGCPNIAVSRGSCVRHGGGSRCTITGCPNRAKLYKKCFQHGGFRTCATDGCTRKAKWYGHCWSHGGGRICEVPECEKVSTQGGLCWAHGGGNRCKLDDCSRRSYQKYGYYCVDHTSYGEKTKRCRKASDRFGSSWVASGTNLH